MRQLMDSAQESIDALGKLGRPVSDDILVYMVSQRLDRETREAWEFSLEGEDFASYEQLNKFLKLKVRSLEASTASAKTSRAITPHSRVRTTAASHASAHHINLKPDLKCIECNGAHPIYKCAKFNARNASQRWDIVKQHNLYLNCLSNYHTLDACKSERTCAQCKKRHHSLLHVPKQKPTNTHTRTNAAVADNSVAFDANLVQSHLSTPLVPVHAIFSTAWVLVTSASQRVVKVRALLDPGSTHTFITRTAVNELRTKTYPTSMQVNGIGLGKSGTVSQIASITVSSVTNTEVALSTEALVLNELTSYVPKFKFPLSRWPHLDGLNFADRDLASDAPIHVIICADIYAYALQDGIIRGRRDDPVALNTIFGWVLSGTSDTAIDLSHAPSVQVHHMHVQEDDLHSTIARFWEIEEVSVGRAVSGDDVKCEKHFVDTHSRSRDGRYIVCIPLREAPSPAIGDTYRRALKCLHSIERRLASRSEERAAYEEFMSEYESLGHMKVVKSQPKAAPVVYLPHHPVVKTTSSTTKTRIVFKASALSTSGKSLNDLQYCGPKMQSDLSLLHLQWRTYKFVYTADIEKMFRQILVDHRDVDLQRILWRHKVSDAVSEYQLMTVTYGTASAPFLAHRVLRQLAEDEGDALPLGREVIRSHMFVDDALFGADTQAEAIAIRNETSALLSKGHFMLRKWSSNSTALLADMDQNNHGLSCDKTLQNDESVKILGIAWRPASDVYGFTLNLSPPSLITKRTMLSQIARIFDPAGWLAPVVVVAKHLMQLLWASKTPWDSPVPQDLHSAWDSFYTALPALAAISIPRWVDTLSAGRFELHGFSDASMKAYAAVVYVRVELPTGDIKVHLLSAKTRVAPLKQLSIPRLELCGAVLLSRLTSSTRSVPAFASCPIHCWTDATIVLAWLAGQSNEWKTFIANRVAEVHTLLPDVSWHHVPGVDNPADLATRGLSAMEIASADLWWHGPTWLTSDPANWPDLSPKLDVDAPLERRVTVYHVKLEPVVDSELFGRFSSWPRMCRVLALCLRFSAQWRACIAGKSRIEELTLVGTRVFSLSQATAFQEEFALLVESPKDKDGVRHLLVGKSLPKGSRLRRLNPFLDKDGIIRVGGRLSLSKLPYAAKYPVVMPHRQVAILLTRHAHE